MSTNKLTGELVLRRVYDETTGTLMTTSAPTEMEIELDAADGDNVRNIPDNNVVSTLATEVPCISMKTIELYVEPNATADSAKIEISPVDSGDVWMEVASSTVAADPSVVKSSGPKSVCARRIRITAVSGSPVVHLVMQAV